MLPHDVAAAIPPFAREGVARLDDAPGAVRAPARERPTEDLVAQLAGHHAWERRALPYLVALLATAAGCHGRRNAKLGVLCDVGQELADALEAHADEEDRELFPALLAGATGTDDFRAGLERMRRHHRALTLLLARIRWLADDFAVPAWGGRAYQALMEELQALEDEVVEHLHLEAHVLLPRLTAAAERAC